MARSGFPAPCGQALPFRIGGASLGLTVIPPEALPDGPFWTLNAENSRRKPVTFLPYHAKKQNYITAWRSRLNVMAWPLLCFFRGFRF